jgi:predicted DNA-binding transcriptional regulator AlpA
MFSRTTFGTAQPAPTAKMLTWGDLAALGIRYHHNYLREMWESGRFPRPIKISPRKLVWRSDEVEAWIQNKLAQGGR